ncbi:MAG: 2OG-Fe(II) oxygenase [Bdellovibrionales bacterium]|nr:2OG-Fe(II) oxygenase [Bdellovibrionales bacterium]
MSWTDQLAERDYAILENFLPLDVCRALALTEREAWARNEYRQARVGGVAPARHEEERSDWLRWVDAQSSGPHAEFFSALAAVRRALTAEFFLALETEEIQATVYEPGAFYRRHLDVFRDKPSRRAITCLYYLNQDWHESQGGAVRLVLPEAPAVDIYPVENRLVLFRADRVPHEVLPPVDRLRFALSGWLLTRS